MKRAIHQTAPAAPPNQKVAVACMVIALVVVTAVGVVHVGRRHVVIRKGYELAGARAELRTLQEENRRLRLEKSVLTAPARIEGLAKSLGMQQPGAGQVRVVRPETRPRTATNTGRPQP